MLHFLTVGYLDEAAVGRAQLSLVRPLDSELIARLLLQYRDKTDSTDPTFEQHRVIVGDGYVRCPWYSPRFNRTSVQFALALSEAAGCLMADVEHARCIARGELEALLSR